MMKKDVLCSLKKILNEIKQNYKDNETIDKKIDLLIKYLFIKERNKNTKKESIDSFKKEIKKIADWYESIYSNEDIDNFSSNKFSLSLLKTDDNDIVPEMLKDVSYPSRVYLSKSFDTSIGISLSPEGIVLDAKEVFYPSTYFFVDRKYVTGEEFEGMHINDVNPILERKGLIDDNSSDIQKMMNDYEEASFKREVLIECVIYEILNRGKDTYSSKRAFLFAKQFNGNLDIPIKYGMFFPIFKFKDFLMEYLKMGGNIDLCCLLDYLKNQENMKVIEKMTIREILEYLSFFDCFKDEEKELHKKIIDILKERNLNCVEKDKQLKKV